MVKGTDHDTASRDEGILRTMQNEYSNPRKIKTQASPVRIHIKDPSKIVITKRYFLSPPRLNAFQ